MFKWKFMLFGVSLALSELSAHPRPDSAIVATVMCDTVIKTYERSADQIEPWVKNLVDSMLGDCRWFRKGITHRHPFTKDYPYKIISIIFESHQRYYVIYEHEGRGEHKHILIIDKTRKNIITDLIFIGSEIKSFAKLKEIIPETFISEEVM